MIRRTFIKKQIAIKPEIRLFTKYLTTNSFITLMLVNKILKGGKKEVAQKIVSDAFNLVNKSLNKDPFHVFEKAIRNIMPFVALKKKTIDKSVIKLPYLIDKLQSIKIAIKWVVESSRKKKSKSAAYSLFLEIIDAYKNVGLSIKKKDELHKMAEANKSFIESESDEYDEYDENYGNEIDPELEDQNEYE